MLQLPSCMDEITAIASEKKSSAVGKAMERLQLTAAEGAVCAVAQTTREALQWQLWSFTGQNLVSWMTVFDYTEPDLQKESPLPRGHFQVPCSFWGV